MRDDSTPTNPLPLAGSRIVSRSLGCASAYFSRRVLNLFRAS